jgi:hypothetical protein
LGFQAEFKDDFVFGKFVFNRKISRFYSPTTPSAKTSGCEKTTLNLESIRRATKEKTQILDSQEANFSFFTD